jgi:hypothetical protein
VAHVDRICEADGGYEWNVPLNLAGRLQVLHKKRISLPVN